MAKQIGERSTQPLGSAMALDWGLWLWWVVAGMVGWAAGWGVGWAVVEFLSTDIAVAGYVGVIAGVTVAGVLQWLVLRRQVAQAVWWIVASIVGGAVVGGVIVAVGADTGFAAEAAMARDVDVGWIVEAALYGAVLGVLQWLVLRRQVAMSGWWVLASTVGWVVGDPVCSSLIGFGTLSWVVFGAVYGAITGLVLVWLLRQPVPAAATEQ